MKRYLITGASRGIGRAIIVAMADKEIHLLLTGRDQKGLNETARAAEEKGSTCELIPADLNKVEEVDKLLAAVGTEPLDLLVNNAGLAYVADVAETTMEQWQKSFAVNVTAPFWLIKNLLPQLKPGSSVVNILSTASKKGFPGWSAYCMSKFALEGFSQSLREEVRSLGIRVIHIYPGATATDIWDDIPGDWPLEKMMPPEEIAVAIKSALSHPPGMVAEEIRLVTLGGNL